MRSKDKEQTVLKPWTIYLWQNGDAIEGAAPVVTKDGVKSIYAHGWLIEKDPEAKRNEEKHKTWRAKVKVKNLLNNTLNVINWYGKKVLDSKGNVDPERLRYLEADTAMRATKQKVDMDDLYKIRKFPSQEITIQEATKFGFRGDRIQNKYVGKI